VTGMRVHGARWQYETEEFPGAEFSVQSGHDSVRHAGYGQRGARIEDTGPKVKGFRVKVPLYNGIRGWPGVIFPDLYIRLVRLFESTPDGTLFHPTRGAIVVHLDDIEEQGDPKTDGGVTLSLTFSEQDGTGGVLDAGPVSSPRAQIEAAQVQALAAVAGSPTLLAQIGALYEVVADGMAEVDEAQRTYAEVAATLESVAHRVKAQAEDPAVMVSDLFPLRTALYTTLAAVEAVREEVGGGVRQYTVTQDASVTEIASLPEVFGDARRGADLCRANRIPDPTLVPAGTVLLLIDE